MFNKLLWIKLITAALLLFKVSTIKIESCLRMVPLLVGDLPTGQAGQTASLTGGWVGFSKEGGPPKKAESFGKQQDELYEKIGKLEAEK